MKLLNKTMEEKEIWKDIPEYEGLYQVSNLGRVKSLSRLVTTKNGASYTLRERILKSANRDGYRFVKLCGGKPKTPSVHILVAMAFLGHTPCGFSVVVNHKDFDRANNNLSNLELVTTRENTNQAHLRGSSEYVGVHFNPATGKWKAAIRINGKRIHLGCFDDENIAGKAYQNALADHNAGKEVVSKKRGGLSDYVGITWSVKNKKWIARAVLNGKRTHIGSFACEHEANRIRLEVLERGFI